MKNYQSIQEIINLLNQNNIPYLILRNYENLLNDEIYMDGHGDIDILCIESKIIVELLKAESSRKNYKNFIGDGTHYHIYVSNQKVSIDLRYWGDGYYCDKWEKNMIDNRVLYNGFYVMDPLNHFYSLIYHAILQKQVFTKEYENRLLSMADELDVKLISRDEKGLLKTLEKFMIQNEYTYTFCNDYYIPLQFQKVNKRLITFHWQRYWKYFKFQTKIQTIEFLVKIKHLIFK